MDICQCTEFAEIRTHTMFHKYDLNETNSGIHNYLEGG